MHISKPQTAALLGAIFLSWISGTAQETTIVRQNAELEKVFSGGQFTEGPAAGPDGSIYFSDLTFSSGPPMEDGHIWRFFPKTGECVIFRSPSGMSNGIKFDAAGRLVVAQGSDYGGRGVLRTDLKTGKSQILVSTYGAQPLNSPNDLAIDRKGRIYFTDPRYGNQSTVRQPVMGVYRIDTGGKTVRIISDLPMPNGIALSPDEKTLYVGCFDEGSDDGNRSAASYIKAYRLSPGGTPGEERTIARFPSGRGPDGMTTDASGALYVAVRCENNPGIAVYDSSGKEFWIPVPEQPTNVAFARPPDDNILYITAGGSLYRIRTDRHGFFSPQ